jgi:hypothetical protein
VIDSPGALTIYTVVHAGRPDISMRYTGARSSADWEC